MPLNIFILLFLALVAYGQQISVAVLPSDGTALSDYEFEALTDEMREAALKVLPTNVFVLLKQDVVVKRLGGAENFIKECKESTCIVDLGKKAQVDYVSQASVGKLGDKIRLKVELYNVRTEGLVGMFNDEAEDVNGLFAIVRKRVPEVFSKISGKTNGKLQNNYGSGGELVADVGILEVKPAYLDGIGSYDDWNLYINGNVYRSFENRLSPGNYSVKLSHKCYEVINFTANMNRGSREIFDMAGNIVLKKGGLALSAERNGEPASEPVFVNGKRVGDTPFNDAVPLCSKIEIGNSMEVVNVALKDNEKVKYTHKSGFVSSEKPYVPRPEQEKSSNASFFAVGLDVMGVAIIYAGTRAEKHNRNMIYTIGGIFLASGIAVHILF